MKVLNKLLPVLFGLLVLAAWEGAVRLNNIPEYLVPFPSAIATALWTDGPELLSSLGITLEVTLAALVLASITGVAIAMALAQWRVAERTFFPYAVFLQVTPIVTVAPFLIMWIENTFLVLLALAWIAAVFPILSNTLLGL